MSIVTQIVDRCHVADSMRDVLRYVISRMKDGKRTWRGLSRHERRAIVSEMCKRHRANRDLYDYVMKG